jgi:uncharacterized metal-binding protein
MEIEFGLGTDRNGNTATNIIQKVGQDMPKFKHLELFVGISVKPESHRVLDGEYVTFKMDSFR